MPDGKNKLPCEELLLQIRAVSQREMITIASKQQISSAGLLTGGRHLMEGKELSDRDQSQ